MPNVFANDMVLQHNKPIPVFGTANANEEVRIAFNHQTFPTGRQAKKTKANADGKWKIIFDALPAGGPYTLMVQSKDKKIELKNILMGDVWLCSGQSNMLFRLNQSFVAITKT